MKKLSTLLLTLLISSFVTMSPTDIQPPIQYINFSTPKLGYDELYDFDIFNKPNIVLLSPNSTANRSYSNLDQENLNSSLNLPADRYNLSADRYSLDFNIQQKLISNIQQTTGPTIDKFEQNQNINSSPNININNHSNIDHNNRTKNNQNTENPELKIQNSPDKVQNANVLVLTSKSFLALLFQEFGDKSFFITAIMATRNSIWLVLTASTFANILMCSLSYTLGHFSTQLIPLTIIKWISACLFFLFGLQMLYQSIMNPTDCNFKQLQEIEQDLNQSLVSDVSHSFSSKNSADRSQSIKPFDIEQNIKDNHQNQQRHEQMSQYLLGQQNQYLLDGSHVDKRSQNLKVFWKCFSLVICAEWGDKSQMTILALAATYSQFYVLIGSILGMLVISVLAVIFGKFIASRVSQRIVQLVSATIFIGFGTLIILNNLNVIKY